MVDKNVPYTDIMYLIYGTINGTYGIKYMLYGNKYITNMV